MDEFIISNGVLVEYRGPGGRVEIPEGVIEIADGVFAEALDLTVNVGKNHFEIRNWEGKEIVEAVLPLSLEKIGCSAFYGCKKLTKVNIPINVTTVGIEAFAGCTALSEVFFDARNCEADALMQYRSMRPINAFAACGQHQSGMRLTVGKNVAAFPWAVFAMSAFSHRISYEVPVHVYTYPEGFPKITRLCFEDGAQLAVIKELCKQPDAFFCSDFLTDICLDTETQISVKGLLGEHFLSSDPCDSVLLNGKQIEFCGTCITLCLNRRFGGLFGVWEHLKHALDVTLGSAVGDALGVPAEFKSRNTLKENPITDMCGYGTHHLPAGTWSDDTSMSLATLDSLKHADIRFDDVMEGFCRWFYKAEYTATDTVFDCGNTCAQAINAYACGNKETPFCGDAGEFSNGNGSLMRIYPIVLFAYSQGYSEDRMIEAVHLASALTHAHPVSKIGCGIYAFVLTELLKKPSKKSVRRGLQRAAAFYGDDENAARFQRLLKCGRFAVPIKKENVNSIRSSGYVVDTLEAAIWCLLTTKSYGESVLKAVNLGEDTDTVAAVTGGLSGALYGHEAIPEGWIKKLKKQREIRELCFDAAYHWCSCRSKTL